MGSLREWWWRPADPSLLPRNRWDFLSRIGAGLIAISVLFLSGAHHPGGLALGATGILLIVAGSLVPAVRWLRGRRTQPPRAAP